MGLNGLCGIDVTVHLQQFREFYKIAIQQYVHFTQIVSSIGSKILI
jgi:hypothetical protein